MYSKKPMDPGSVGSQHLMIDAFCSNWCDNYLDKLWLDAICKGKPIRRGDFARQGKKRVCLNYIPIWLES